MSGWDSQGPGRTVRGRIGTVRGRVWMVWCGVRTVRGRVRTIRVG